MGPERLLGAVELDANPLGRGAGSGGDVTVGQLVVVAQTHDVLMFLTELCHGGCDLLARFLACGDFATGGSSCIGGGW